ncbi:hypothetical protein ACLOJK_004070, partial [Asimina triloba]
RLLLQPLDALAGQQGGKLPNSTWRRGCQCSRMDGCPTCSTDRPHAAVLGLDGRLRSAARRKMKGYRHQIFK